MQTYHMPQVEADVRDLTPEGASGVELTPATTVLVIHRGRHVIVDKFDGRDYRILPGYTYMPYGAARHFQARQVIPGTRNPELGTEQSFLGVVGLDDPWMVAPLTDEEVERFGAKVEAIDRDALTDPADRSVRLIRAGVGGPGRRGGGMRPQIDTTAQASEAAREAAAHIFDKPETTDAQVDAAEAAQEQTDDGDETPRKRGRK